jgi:hypothetical protein
MMAINQDDVKVYRLFNQVKDFLDAKTRSLLSWMLTLDESVDLGEYKAATLDVDGVYVATQIRAIRMAYVDRVWLGDMHEHAVLKWNQAKAQQAK